MVGQAGLRLVYEIGRVVYETGRRSSADRAGAGWARSLHPLPAKEVVVLVNRPIVVCVMACALLASVVAAPAAIAGPLDQERYLESYGSPPATDDGAAAAQAQESYYSSYVSPQNTTSGGADWLPTALFSVALVLAAIAIIVVLRRRRFHTGRRTARIAI
jgi:hypothetical protein